MRTVDYAPRYRWDDQLGLKHGSVEQAVHGLDVWRRAQLGEISINDYWRAVGNHLRLTSDQVSQLRVDFYSGDQLDPLALATLRRCQEKSLKIGLLSNNTTDVFDSISAAQRESWFDAIVISADVHVM